LELLSGLWGTSTRFGKKKEGVPGFVVQADLKMKVWFSVSVVRTAEKGDPLAFLYTVSDPDLLAFQKGIHC
jgi:hypothetical protein